MYFNIYHILIYIISTYSLYRVEGIIMTLLHYIICTLFIIITHYSFLIIPPACPFFHTNHPFYFHVLSIYI